MTPTRTHSGSLSLLTVLFGVLVSACASGVFAGPPSPTPTPSPADTATSVPPTLTPSPTGTDTPLPPSDTPTATSSLTPSPTNTSIPTVTPLPSRTPRPTVSPQSLPVPPALGQGQDHLYFGRPIGPGGNIGIASSYRFGSTLGGAYRTHHGVEFGNPTGAPVVAIGPGTVLYAGPDTEVLFGPFGDFYGNVVILQLAQDWSGHPIFALYGHLSEFAVQPGQPVNTADVLGRVGASGVADGPHLHFEIRMDDPKSYWNVYNPELWLVPVPGFGVLAVRVTDADGRYLPGVRVGIVCSDGAYRYVDTYWDNGVNPDPLWGENGALTDVPAGKCTAETRVFGTTLRQSVEVVPGRTAFVLLSMGQ